MHENKRIFHYKCNSKIVLEYCWMCKFSFILVFQLSLILFTLFFFYENTLLLLYLKIYTFRVLSHLERLYRKHHIYTFNKISTSMIQCTSHCWNHAIIFQTFRETIGCSFENSLNKWQWWCTIVYTK